MTLYVSFLHVQNIWSVTLFQEATIKNKADKREYMKQYRIICHLNTHNQMISFQILSKLYSKYITQLISHVKTKLCISPFLLQVQIDKLAAKTPFDKAALFAQTAFGRDKLLKPPCKSKALACKSNNSEFKSHMPSFKHGHTRAHHQAVALVKRFPGLKFHPIHQINVNVLHHQVLMFFFSNSPFNYIILVSLVLLR